ncbi:MAG: ATP-dependent sacrificial sulfur transferase LarE [Candidatus Heimdallarchaeaceae archaeon]
MPEEHWEKLTSYFEDKIVAIAFSGGLDSTVLLEAAISSAKEVKTIFIKTEFVQEEDLEKALEYTKQRKIDLKVLETKLLQDKNVTQNNPERCYFCKRHIFSKILELASLDELDLIAEGTNYSDLSDYRPGIRAIRELGIKSPYLELKITKEEIRAIAEEQGFKVPHSTPTTCLATRIAYDIPLSIKRLDRIAEAERIVRELTSSQIIRVRDHGDFARIELAKDKIDILLDKDIREKIVNGLKNIGFKYVTLDLEGYVQGSMNRMLGETR